LTCFSPLQFVANFVPSNTTTPSKTVEENWKAQALPLARIKKIMKSEEAIFQELERERLQQQAAILGGVPGTTSTRFMIASEAPVLLGKACEIMIREMTVRGWRHTERSKRRTLQRQDLYAAVGESEMFDFLIDLVPRMASVPPTDAPAAFSSSAIEEAPGAAALPDNVMTISDAENRNAQLQQLQGQMQERYMSIQQQRVQPDGSGAPAPAQQAQQPQVMMNPQFQIHPPQQQDEVSQWQAAPAPTTDNNNDGTNPISHREYRAIQ
jgi:nuclear transcription factor Y gamma